MKRVKILVASVLSVYIIPVLLVVIPAVVYGVCSFLPLDKNAFGICVLLAAMPAGATTSILAEKYGVDSPFATKMVIFSTLLSLPTICLWSMVL